MNYIIRSPNLFPVVPSVRIAQAVRRIRTVFRRERSARTGIFSMKGRAKGLLSRGIWIGRSRVLMNIPG